MNPVDLLPARSAGWAASGAVIFLSLVLLLAISVRAIRAHVTVTVRGRSMEPTYRDLDRVLVRRRSAIERGQVVVVDGAVFATQGHRAPPLPPRAAANLVAQRRWAIKRVAAVAGDPVPRDLVPVLAEVPETHIPPGNLILLGDNSAASVDSRRIGYIPENRVLGSVLRRMSR